MRWSLMQAIVGAVLALTSGFVTARVSAQGGIVLTADVINQRLSVGGSGFQPHEQIDVKVELLTGSGAVRDSREFTVRADEQGRFSLETGITSQEIHRGFPGPCPSGVKFGVTAMGDKGSRGSILRQWIADCPPSAGIPSPAANDRSDFALPNGWFYMQASAQPGRGFAVMDEAGVQFWSEFQRLGGIDGVGYPISQRFVWDGFVSQAFQKMVFQWRPEEGQVYAVNIFDLMHERGFDEWLRTDRATPPIADWSSDADRSWPEVVAAHQVLLTDPDIRATYFAVDDPVTLYGLPMAPIQDMGNVLVLRAQRGIIQKWLTDVPWARAGQVTIANSGDVAKEAELLPPDALIPVASP